MSAFRVLTGVAVRGWTSTASRPPRRSGSGGSHAGSDPLREVLVGVVVALLLAGSGGEAMAGATPSRPKSAVGYLASQQRPNGVILAFSPIGSTADAVVSMVGARAGKGAVNGAMGYLERQVERGHVVGVGLTAKVAMAVEAVKLDGEDFAGTNLVSAIRSSRRPNGRYGASTPVFDHALAILALRAAGRSPAADAVTWLVNAQCDDGGWAFDDPATGNDDEHCVDESDPGSDFFASDTNTTALAVQALRKANLGRLGRDPIEFFEALRDESFGGWGYSWGFEVTDANSTALALQAYAAAGAAEPAGAGDALKDLQYRACGAWAFTWVDDGAGGFERSLPNVGATIGGILGLLRLSMPVPPVSVNRLAPAPDTGSCPGD
jgi:hypothetical protein